MYTIGLYAMAALYVLAGLNHFRVPDFYLPLIPPYFPNPVFWNAAAGAAEVLLGIGLLVPRTRAASAWFVIGMLVVFFSVHIYMVQERNGAFARVPEWLLWARLPLQVALIAWASLYSNLWR